VENRDLEYFLACCESGSFTAAARKMHIVQSAMSSAVARLENELGVTLFDRSVTPVAVTEHGAALRAGAQHILDAVQAARDDVAAVSGQVRGTVVLGSTLHTGPLDLAAVLADVRDRHPGVVIHLRQSTAGTSRSPPAQRTWSPASHHAGSPCTRWSARRWSSPAGRITRSPAAWT
jgi:DNA-binding transcriptional LysR family regulator